LNHDISDIKVSFKELKCCVLIPTFNNATTLKGVIESVREFTENIIVVNDGSTDNTADVIKSIGGVDVLSYAPNKGKGVALRRGFDYAYSKGFLYAITIDSDGQHFAADLPKFIEKLKVEKHAIIIGARDMEQSSVPGKSSFGYKFSNFWFTLETGINSPDTQSGYRLYPLAPLNKIKFLTWKYEFEIEVIVRAAWSGVNVCAVPIHVYYPPASERISHFRPFKDFSRITVLNVFLVLMAVFYYIPLRLINSVKKKSFREIIRDHILDGKESNFKKSSSIALGIFIGIVPIWGYQIISVFAIAHLLKLNKAIAVLASNISFFPMIPFILYLSYKTGGLLLGKTDMIFRKEITWEFVKEHLYQYILGSICFAFIAAMAFGLVSYILLSFFRPKRLNVV
jgi:glycosyltransferase involved in cell wall biosynthesis